MMPAQIVPLLLSLYKVSCRSLISRSRCIIIATKLSNLQTSNTNTIFSWFTVPPNITFPDDNFTYFVNESDPVTFECTATGIPPPSINWYKNGTLLNSSYDVRITIPDTGVDGTATIMTPRGSDVMPMVMRTLTLDNTTDGDSGTYTCVAENSVTSVSQDFELFVNGEF